VIYSRTVQFFFPQLVFYKFLRIWRYPIDNSAAFKAQVRCAVRVACMFGRISDQCVMLNYLCDSE
jgi:hypothetical protein